VNIGGQALSHVTLGVIDENGKTISTISTS